MKYRLRALVLNQRKICRLLQHTVYWLAGEASLARPLARVLKWVAEALLSSSPVYAGIMQPIYALQTSPFTSPWDGQWDWAVVQNALIDQLSWEYLTQGRFIPEAHCMNHTPFSFNPVKATFNREMGSMHNNKESQWRSYDYLYLYILQYKISNLGTYSLSALYLRTGKREIKLKK